MSTLAGVAAERQDLRVPEPLARRFEAVVFDWDGTAVPDRKADAGRVRAAVEALCGLGMDVFVVTGTNVGNIDGQLGARPGGPGHLHLCLNRGSEVFSVDEGGVELAYRRIATEQEDAALTAAAEATVSALADRGLSAEIVSQRLNRRKIDLIPHPEWVDPPKARIGELLAAVEARLRSAGIAGLADAVELASACARSAGLADPRVTSDAKYVEIGLTDKSDSAKWVFGHLRGLGVSPELVLVAGDEFGQLGGLKGSDSFLLVPEAAGATAFSVGSEPTGTPPGIIALGGGPAAFVAVLDDQIVRRRDVPGVAESRLWSLDADGLDPELERSQETLLVLADGTIGSSGSPLWPNPHSAPRVLAGGLYVGDGPTTELVRAPLWQLLTTELPARATLRRLLDLRTGLLHQTLRTPEGDATAVLFSSLAAPGTVAVRAQGAPALVEASVPLTAPTGVPSEEDRSDGAAVVRVPADEGGVAAAAFESEEPGRVERIGAYVVDSARAPDADEALSKLAESRARGFEALLRGHRSAWASRWESADVAITGDDELQLAVRFALYHLMGSVASSGEAAVGARGLTGVGYRGHVFWDTDVFVLPFLAATHPPAARALLEYRVRRLPAAKEAARAIGLKGARFPWESAGRGVDVTPTYARDHAGRIVAIRTGQREEHIVADVAWAADCYLAWTGDEEFAAGPGRDLFVETARYWASRVRRDPDGRAHIYAVIGPDEYHEPVDDNAYTNVMARWNLRRAAEAVERYGGDVHAAERERWLETAEAIVDGYDADTGLYEEFAGFFRLEPIVIAEIAPHRPIAADLLLGAERVAGAQVVKQADVLMLHHLVPNEVRADSLAPNLEFYEPRTAHGSSLSPAIHASLFARAGRLGRALQALRLAARIDLDDVTGTTAGGLHLATMGGVWQALAFGVAGLRPRGDTLVLDPRLPDAWDQLELRVRFRGRPATVRIRHDGVSIDAEPELRWEVLGQ